jgi:pimeloyl-ACP methyl ester carboxylesterase
VTTDKDYEIGYASVNGLDLSYEIHGSGQPLILLAGGFMPVEAMGELVPQLAETRRVIGVALQGHGHTADIERPLRFELMADDIAALIGQLGLDQADMFGFSLGGGVALRTAIQHPEVVRKLALASTAFKREGWYPEVLAAMASLRIETFAGTRVHQAYLKTSPRPQAWPTFVAKLRQLLSEDYDWAESVAALTPPTLLLVCLAAARRTATCVVSRLPSWGCSRAPRMWTGPHRITGSWPAPTCSCRSSQNSSIQPCQRPGEPEAEKMNGIGCLPEVK